MKNKTWLKPLIATIVIFIGFILIVVFSDQYEKNAYEQTWLVCNQPNRFQNYTETVKYKFDAKTNKLKAFYRVETYETEDTDDLEEKYKYFKNLEDNYPVYKAVKYEVKKEDNKIVMNTFIEVDAGYMIYDSYMKENGLKYNDSIERVQESFKTQGYTCKITNK